MTVLMIIDGVIAFGVGIYLGLPGDSRIPSQEAEEAIMEGRSGPRHRAKQRFVAVEWLFRRRKESKLRNKTRPPFRL